MTNFSDVGGTRRLSGSGSVSIEIDNHDEHSVYIDLGEHDLELGISHSQGSHTEAMIPGSQTSLSEKDRVFGSRQTYGSTEPRSDISVHDIESGETIIPIDLLYLATVSGHPPPDGGLGLGGCCSVWDKPCQTLKAGIVQALSTAVTFGTKPLVEAAILRAFGVTALGVSAPIVPLIATSVLGGLYVGLIHTAASKLVSGLMNTALGVETYSPKPGSNELLGEVLTVDLPVMGSFIGGYALRGMVMEGTTDIWADAVSKLVTSTGAGAVQGMLTDALRQAYTSVYEAKGPVSPGDDKFEFFLETAKGAFLKQFESGKSVGHDFFGKIIGSTLGMIYSQQIGSTGLGATEKGALGMTAYLSSWFTGIHVTSGVLEKVFDVPTGVQTPPPQFNGDNMV